jgi:cytochrome c biogenesis protein
MATGTEGEQPTDRGEPDASLLRALWRTLQSVRTAIYLLIVIAAAITIGAVVPQGRAPEYYQMVYGHWWGAVVTGLGVDRLYGSTWFVVLIALLLLNLAACVSQSWRRASVRYRGPRPQALARKLEGPQASACWHATDGPVDSAERLARTLALRGWVVRTEDSPQDRIWVVARRWPFAAYGSPVTHTAIFLLALGAILGCLPWTSLDDRMTLVEGETRGTTDRDVALPFEVRLDDFRIQYYAETGDPSSYESDITLLADTGETRQSTATVISPVNHRGITLAQSSWAIAAIELSIQKGDEPEDHVFFSVVEAVGPHGTQSWSLGRDRLAPLESRASALVADSFVADAFERDGEIAGSLSRFPRNPAVHLSVVSGLDSGEHEFQDLGWLRPGGEARHGKYRIRFGETVCTSTLSLRKDPGMPLVWLGFILVTLGMIVTFYVHPRTLLFELRHPSGEQMHIRIAPSGREMLEADRNAVETAMGARLRPLAHVTAKASQTRG